MFYRCCISSRHTDIMLLDWIVLYFYVKFHNLGIDLCNKPVHAILVCMYALCMPFVVITSGCDKRLTNIGLPSIKLIEQVCEVTIKSVCCEGLYIQYDPFICSRRNRATLQSFCSIAPRQKQAYRNIYELWSGMHTRHLHRDMQR